jgi:hypothetical protein
LADKLDDERVPCKGLVEGNILGLGDLVDEIGAAFKGELFRQDERVVAIEKDGSDLECVQRSGGRQSFVSSIGLLCFWLGKIGRYKVVARQVCLISFLSPSWHWIEIRSRSYHSSCVTYLGHCGFSWIEYFYLSDDWGVSSSGSSLGVMSLML